MSTYRPDRLRQRTAPAPAAVAKKAPKKKAPRKPAGPLPPGSLTAEALTLCLPVPCAALRPNDGHAHWSAVHRARKSAKARASLITRSLAGPAPALVPTSYSLIYHTRNRWDEDNAVASAKAYLDGIASALSVNDRTFRLRSVSHVTDSKSPHVEIIMHLTSPTS